MVLQAKDEDLTGKKVGEYEILTRIGAGGMGVVYEGVQPVIGKRVAVKVLLPQLSSDLELVERFLSEARAVNAIRHRGIIDIFSFGQLPSGQHYFVMEFLDGDGFDRLIKVKAPIAPFDVLSWSEECLDALDAVHTSGIIHRDIKPSNLFLVNPGRGRSYVKLLDFGIAKLGALKGEATPQTRASVIIGTPDYMSPEQARGRNISPSTDLYALACVMFELFTGKRLFKGENAMQTMFMHVENQPPKLSEYLPDVPAELDDLLLWTLEKDPANRPATAAEMKQHLEAIKAMVPNDTTQSFAALPRISGGGPATPGPGSTRSRPMTTPAPQSRRLSKPVVEPVPEEEDDLQPLPDSTRIVAAPTRETPAQTSSRGALSTDPAAPAVFDEVPEPSTVGTGEPMPADEEPVGLASPPRSLSVVWVFASLVALGAAGTFGYLMLRPAPEQALVVQPPPPPPVKVEKTVEEEAAATEKAALDKAAADEIAENKVAAEKKATADAAAAEKNKAAAADVATKKAAADEAAAEKKKAAAEKAEKKAAADQAAAADAAAKKAAADEAAAEKKKAAAEKKAATDQAAAEKKKAAPEEKKVAAVDKKKTGKVYTAEDVAVRLVALEKKLAAKEAKAGGKDRVVRQFMDQAASQAGAAKTDEDRREVWKFLSEVDKQLGP